jgi:hypothetical protein
MYVCKSCPTIHGRPPYFLLEEGKVVECKEGHQDYYRICIVCDQPSGERRKCQVCMHVPEDVEFRIRKEENGYYNGTKFFHYDKYVHPEREKPYFFTEFRCRQIEERNHVLEERNHALVERVDALENLVKDLLDRIELRPDGEEAESAVKRAKEYAMRLA